MGSAEERVRSILAKTNDVFVFYGLHGQKYEGGDLASEIMAVIESEMRALAQEIKEEGGFWEQPDVLEVIDTVVERRLGKGGK
jgi:hypothetical protein